tara:strand:- start:1102 stop:1395 length:294 start_codon:yes stop_codon:yes gene_type:complete
VRSEKWKAGHDPKKFTCGCFLSDLTGFGEISPAPTFRLFYIQSIVKLQQPIYQTPPNGVHNTETHMHVNHNILTLISTLGLYNNKSPHEIRIQNKWH